MGVNLPIGLIWGVMSVLFGQIFELIFSDKRPYLLAKFDD